ncbi:MAG: CHAD domain-containing protein [Janthinobacterium lividum]
MAKGRDAKGHDAKGHGAKGRGGARRQDAAPAKKKVSRADRVSEVDLEPLPPEPPTIPGRPPGQRLYDMPFSSVEPRLINADVGLHNLVVRGGHNAPYAIDVTLLDAPDHRLIRSGVLLAHRVLDGRGEWFLTAPEWQPLLPKDRIELMGHADLPDDLAALIRPLRRRATLGPVAALNCDRREFALRDDAGTTLALLRDDKVTVRRGGLTTARYREVMLTPVGPGLSDDQRAFVDRAFRNVGANRVPRFPRLMTRLGAPATGSSDIPAEQALDGAMPFRRFVGSLVGNRLREVVRCDLALRSGDADALPRLSTEAAALRAELAGLAPGLDPAWAEDLTDDLDWLVTATRGPTAPVGAGAGAAPLRSERYLSVLERLVGAARSPRLVVDGAEPTVDVLAGMLATETRRLREVADPLRADATDAAWDQVRRAVDRLRALAQVAQAVLPDASATALALLRRTAPLLAAVRLGLPPAVPDVDAMTPVEAFAAGREHERARLGHRRARQDFVDRWAKTVRKLGA